MGDANQIIEVIAVWAVPVILAVTLHEAAHGWVAWKLGDDTAYQRGRVTFNPLRHIDLVGTILIPAMLVLLKTGFVFGWAKPVPVNFARLGWPRRDMILVAAAGPGMNLALAIASALLLHVAALLPESAAELVEKNLFNSLVANVLLAIFNMLPLPPLDGGRVVTGLLPASLARPYARLERFGLFILVVLIFILPRISEALGMRVSPFEWLIIGPMRFVIGAIISVVGLR